MERNAFLWISTLFFYTQEMCKIFAEKPQMKLNSLYSQYILDQIKL